jgi:hypothetical protein
MSEAKQQMSDSAIVALVTVAVSGRMAGTRQKGADDLMRIGARAVEAVMARLRDQDPLVRRRAVAILRRIGDARAIGPLVETLHDSDAHVQQVAALALGKLGDSRAVEPLGALLLDMRCSGHTRDGMYMAVTTALSELGAPAVKPLLAALTQCPRQQGREEIIRALGQLGDARAVEPLIALLDDPDDSIRYWAASSLGVIGDPRAIAPLIAAYAKKYPGYEREFERLDAAADALEMIGFPAVDALVELLANDDEDIRHMAVKALGAIGDRRAVLPLIGALGDPDEYVRSAAAHALGALRDSRARARLAALEHHDAYADVRKAAKQALAEIDALGALSGHH